MDNLNFQSPTTHLPLDLADNQYESQNKKEQFPVFDSVPILIDSPHTHLKEIKELIDSHRGGWYSKEQQESPYYKPHKQKRLNIIRSLLQSYIKNNNGNPINYIELGCGDGKFSNWIQDLIPENSNAFFTDYNLLRLLRAKSNLSNIKNATIFASDVTKPVFKNETFDFIFSNHVIEHIPNDYGLFATASYLLKDKGQFLLGCPTEGCLFWMLAYALYPKSIRESDHIHFYNADTLIKMATKNGLKCIKTFKLGYGFPEWRIDAALRKYKFIDDFFHHFGKLFFRNQGSAIYLLFEKQ